MSLLEKIAPKRAIQAEWDEPKIQAPSSEVVDHLGDQATQGLVEHPPTEADHNPLQEQSVVNPEAAGIPEKTKV